VHHVRPFLPPSRIILSQYLIKTFQTMSKALHQRFNITAVLFTSSSLRRTHLFPRNPQHQSPIRSTLLMIRPSRRLPNFRPQSLPFRTQTRNPQHSPPIIIHINNSHPLFHGLANAGILQRVVFFVYRPQRRRREESLVFIVGEDVVDFGVVILAGYRVFDKGEEGFEVWWWGGGVS
jgi:hypothetical protein